MIYQFTTEKGHEVLAVDPVFERANSVTYAHTKGHTFVMKGGISIDTIVWCRGKVSSLNSVVDLRIHQKG